MLVRLAHKLANTRRYCFTLLISLEAIPGIRIYPFARFFDFVDQHEDDREAGGDVHTSWFFIALTFHSTKPLPRSPANGHTSGNAHEVDLTGAIRDFGSYVDQWEHRLDGMDMEIDHVTRAAIPSWIKEAADGCEKGSRLQKKRGPDEDSGVQSFSEDSTPHATKAAAANGSKRSKVAAAHS